MRFILVSGSLLVLTMVSFSSNVFGQPSANDSLVHQASIKNALSIYHQSLEKPTGLFNGSQYITYANLIKDDHPYFQSDSMKSGDIIYDSVVYENVSMFYDLVKELVVINDPFKIYKLSLIPEKVNGFTVLNHKFIRIEPDSLNRHVISAGYYDLLYHGSINLYERELKRMQEQITNQELTRIIIPQNNFYLEIAGKFHQVNRKNSLLKLLSTRRKEIQQFIRKNKLNYRKDKENALVKVMTYYDTLPAIDRKK